MADQEEIQRKIEKSIDDIPNIVENVELMAANSARVQLELRTFSTGNTGVKDVNGKNLKPYVKPKLVDGKRGPKKDKYGTHAEKRLKAGLQIDNKDLVFSKDTSVIKDNITIGLDGDKPALGFVKEEGALVAGYQEEQNDTKIFQLNDSEREAVKSDVKDYVMNSLRKLVDSWR